MHYTYNMNTNTVTRTARVNVKDLNANDRFMLPGGDTIMVCTFRRTIGSQTRVEYKIPGSPVESMFTRVNLSSIDLVV
jgi:hypothetical protein